MGKFKGRRAGAFIFDLDGTLIDSGRDIARSANFVRAQFRLPQLPPETIEVIYHLHSQTHDRKLALKVKLDRADPRVPTVEPVWRMADWYERECYDLLGVVFEGHPDLRRILLPFDWEGHPLRKDYVAPETYRGITNKP